MVPGEFGREQSKPHAESARHTGDILIVPAMYTDCHSSNVAKNPSCSARGTFYE
jgi:hypothetical protein